MVKGQGQGRARSENDQDIGDDERVLMTNHQWRGNEMTLLLLLLLLLPRDAL